VKLLLSSLIPLVSFLYYPFTYEEFETPKAFALLIFGCIAFFSVKWKSHSRDRLAWSLFGMVISASISTYLSIDKHVSLFGNPKAPMGLLIISSLFLVYLVAVETKYALYQATDTVLICGFVIAVYALLQTCGVDYQEWNGTLKDVAFIRPISTLGHPNFMANYLAMALPFGLHRFDRQKSLLFKVILAVVCTAYIAAIFCSLSRGMIISAFIGAASYLILSRRKTKPVLIFTAISLIISIVAFVSIPGLKKDATARLGHMLLPGHARLEYPMTAINIWKTYPWVGSGTDTFELSFRNHRTAYYWSVESGGSPHRAHNDLLNTLATQGILGVLSVLILTLTIAIYAFRVRSRFGFAAIGSILAFYAAGITSFVIISTGTIFMISLAILKSQQRD
jgi:putative inorganic carbon (HCO3(-)) transporter